MCQKEQTQEKKTVRFAIDDGCDNADVSGFLILTLGIIFLVAHKS